MGQHSRPRQQTTRHLTRQHILHGRRRTLVGDVRHLHARHVQQQFCRQMTGHTRAARGITQGHGF